MLNSRDPEEAKEKKKKKEKKLLQMVSSCFYQREVDELAAFQSGKEQRHQVEARSLATQRQTAKINWLHDSSARTESRKQK
ncbi:hypothetical protein ACFX13_038664 [Malus domestica]